MGYYEFKFKGVEYRAAVWLADGTDVLIRWASPTEGAPHGTALRCKAVVVAGNMARVINKERGVDRWLPLNQLFVPCDSKMSSISYEDILHPDDELATRREKKKEQARR